MKINDWKLYIPFVCIVFAIVLLKTFEVQVYSVIQYLGAASGHSHYGQSFDKETGEYKKQGKTSQNYVFVGGKISPKTQLSEEDLKKTCTECHPK